MIAIECIFRSSDGGYRSRSVVEIVSVGKVFVYKHAIHAFASVIECIVNASQNIEGDRRSMD